MVKFTLVLRHYVEHCRLADKASVRVREAAGELAGVAAVALCLLRRGCTAPPDNFSSSKPRARKTEGSPSDKTLRVEVVYLGSPRICSDG